MHVQSVPLSEPLEDTACTSRIYMLEPGEATEEW